MIELLRSLSHWVEGFADTQWAVAILIINSFTEAIFNPIPVDPLLIGMSVLNPKSALLFAALATLASVAGALVGHWIGLRLGRPIVLKFISAKKVDKVEALFHKYGSWAVLVAAFTPIPYKVFAVTAGVLELPRRPFIVVSLIGRGARFFLLGGLIFFFGQSIQEFIGRRFELLTLLFAIFLVITAIVGFLVIKWHRARSAASLLREQGWSGESPSLGQSVEGND